MAAAIYIGYVYAAVGANKSVAGFGDEHTSSASDDALALGERQLCDASIDFMSPSPSAIPGGRSNGLQINQLSFRFRNNLVLDDENVAGAQRAFDSAQGRKQFG